MHLGANSAELTTWPTRGYAVQDSVFFARFKAGEVPFPDGRIPPGDSKKRLEMLLETVVDVPIIMNTMANAIRKNVATSS